MTKVFLMVSAFLVAGAAHAETWRMAPKLIHQWSLFVCVASLPERFWDFNLEGAELKAAGPEGVTWYTTVAANGSFKVNFHVRWRGEPMPAEMTGNVNDKYIQLHNIRDDCWYQLELK